MIEPLTCVILAAGTSSRFGDDKLFHRIDGEALLARAIRACGAFATVVVAGTQTIAKLDPSRVELVPNERPELGMAYSLQRANERIEASHAIAVLPADLALIEPEHVAWVVAASHDADVTHPLRKDGTPGHPVVFSARARTRIAALPPGDTIKQLRNRAGLTRLVLAVNDAWPYLDIDQPGDLERVRKETRGE
jgi:molybdenum cofactor cytidylyltransferase